MKDWFQLKTIRWCCALLFSSAMTAQADLSMQREDFRLAYTAVESGKLDDARLLLPKLQGYPLTAWLEFKLLIADFENVPDAALARFTQNNPYTLMSDQLYARWAARLASQGKWSTLLAVIPLNKEQLSTQCYRAQALWNSAQLNQGLELAKDLWNSTQKEFPSDCAAVLNQLQAQHMLASDEVWQRVKSLIAKNRIGAARSLQAYLSEADQAALTLWLEVRTAPSKKLPELLAKPESEQLRAILVDALKEIADDNLATALPLWEQAQKTFKFTEQEIGEVESRFGLWEAWRHDSNGLQRLKRIPTEQRTVEGQIGLARLAMRSSDWPALLDASTALVNADEADDEWDTWSYWQARAYEQLRDTAKSRPLYEQLAQHSTYYGFLAADRIEKNYDGLEAAPPDRSQRIQGIKKLAVYQRWLEWVALGERSQARKEWFRLIQVMDKEGVLAAAELALSQGDANLAIWTVSKIKDWNSVDLRFPLMYEQIVMEQARSQGIRPEWILGIMRRESAFDASAESSAKALGLMQLMPSTARDIGRQMGVQVVAKEDILQPDLNVKLGSAYLRGMLKRFAGNYAQATAAYNAGPGRVPKWAPDRTLEADQWVESIPYDETRKYVRAVMAYTTVYDHKLNKDNSLRLSMRLQPVPAKN